MSIVKPSTAFKAGADWVSAEVRAYMKDQVAIHVDTVTDLRDSDMEQARFVYIKSKAALYRLNLSSGAADDGDTAIHDNLSRRYLKITGTGPGGAFWDVAVDALADRDPYDAEAANFAVFVADTGSGRAALYVKNSATSADWSDPFYFTPVPVEAVMGLTVNIQDTAGIAAGIYPMTDRHRFARTYDSLVAKRRLGTGSAVFHVAVDGVPATDSFTVTDDLVSETGLGIAVADGEEVSVVVESADATVVYLAVEIVGG